MYYKVVVSSPFGVLYSIIARGALQTIYFHNTWVTPPFGPALAFKTLKDALAWVGTRAAEIWGCEGEPYSAGNLHSGLLNLKIEHSGESIRDWWDRGGCGGSWAVPEGTVALEHIKLVCFAARCSNGIPRLSFEGKRILKEEEEKEETHE